MGKKKRKIALDQPSSTPRWPTQVRGKMPGGRLLGNNSAWLYKTVPLSPVVDAVSPAATWQAAEPLLSAFEEIASITPVGVPARRFANRGKYRQVHLLLVNVPMLYRPHPGRLSSYLGSQFHGAVTQRRVLLFGVRLSASMDYTSKEALRSLADDLWYGRTSPGAFDEDFALVEPALERAGLRTPRPEEVRLADSWWNQGHYPDVPYLPTFNHIYFFGSAQSMKVAEEHGNDPAGWPQIDDKHAVTFMSLQDPPIERPQNAASASVQWVSRLLNTGALAVSLRGGVEPARVTYGELRHKRKAFLADLDDRLKSGAMDRHEQQQMLGQLETMEQVYADGGPPTFTDASVVAAVSGRVHDADMLSGQAGLHLRPMDYLQKSAFYETMLCSDSRANPHLHDMPSHAVAASGLPSLSKVGDTDGALLGFTERDRQPALLEPVAASRTDREPIMVVPGGTGSGKTLSMLWLANQFAKLGTPSVFLDPKASSDHSDAVTNVGGQVYSLDQLSTADGVFDPVRFSPNPETAVDLAASAISTIDPFGSRKDELEADLINALRYGVVERGATCTGQALQIALADGEAGSDGEWMVDQVLKSAKSTLASAVVGLDPAGEPLRTAEGLSLVKVGDMHLPLPDPKALEQGGQKPNMTQRTAMAVVRMMVFGATMALAGRGGGVLLLDEGWVFLRPDNIAEVEMLGRVARAFNVLPIIMTQRMSDTTKVDLENYISRGLILPMGQRSEAVAALEMFGLDPSPERVDRLVTPKSKSESADDEGLPNWDSMHTLKDPESGEVLRGTIGVYVDLVGRAVPVELTIPGEFLWLASTNPDDVAARRAAKAQHRQGDERHESAA